MLTDGGGYEFYLGSDGKWHVRRVPPWNPDLLNELVAAVDILRQASTIKDAHVAQKFVNFASSVIDNRTQQIVGYLNKVEPAAAR